MALWIAAEAIHAQPLPGTAPLTGDSDRSEEMRAGMERYLDRETQALAARRGEYWRRDFSSPAAYEASVAPNRERLRRNIGLIDPRVANPDVEYVGSTDRPAKLAEYPRYTVSTVRWQVYDGVFAEGLLFEPKGRVEARVVALPDADESEGTGLLAHELAARGCQVLAPTLVSRAARYSGNDAIKRFTNQPHREWIYRQAYTLGRHMIGYEVDQVLAAVDWFARQNAARPVRIGVAGWGEGGLLALYSASVDPRINVALVSGYFGPREQLWREPIYRNVFGLLREFGDAEIASLIAPRVLVVEASRAPEIEGPPAPPSGVRASAAPGRITTPPDAAVRGEFDRARQLVGSFASALRYHAVSVPAVVPAGAATQSLPFMEPARAEFLRALNVAAPSMVNDATLSQAKFDPTHLDEQQRRLVTQLERHTQALIARTRDVRDELFWKPIKLTTPEAWNQAMQPQREKFWSEINGRLPRSDAPLNPRSRPIVTHPDFTGHEVVIDVLPDVTLWGYLLFPKSFKPGERRPVVIAQHGLSGQPADLLNEDRAARAHQVYKAFAAQLVRREYVVFVPHFPWTQLYDYRRLVRKAQPLGLTPYSFLLAHHGRLLDWLTQQPFADPQRIAFYGLSWGGKVSLRIPALEPRYMLSICSGDFNEWIWKNATVDWPNSYMFSPESDMFDFNLGMTFGHAEMAAMIAPRPFMVERGHGDGVGLDEWVAFEYARVRRLYNKLKIPERTEIEFFDGLHEINAVGTLTFLQRHLNWPPSSK